MPNSAFTENSAEAARAFVEHLRRHPAEARQDPTALAARFGLEPEFVRRALARLPASERPEPSPRRSSALAERAGGFVAFLDGAVERAARNPVRFEALSILAMVAILVLVSLALPSRLAGFGLRGAAFAVVTLATVAIQLAVFYRRRMVRYALYGALTFGIGTAIPMMVLTWLGLQRGNVQTSGGDVRQGFVVFAVGLSMLALGGIYGGVAALASILGGWVHLRRADEEWERQSRQELLERYFALQKRLEQSPTAPEASQGWETWPAVRAVRKRPVAAAGALGVGAGLVNVLLGLAFGAKAGVAANAEAYGLVAGVHALDSYVLFALVAFLSGGTARGLLTALAYAAGGLLALMVPLAGYGPAFLFHPMQLFNAALGLGFALFLGALMGVGSTIQRRTAREGRLQRNDGATLVAEMLEIQWRLEEDATSVTVLVVDAAKSTAMKAGADPLDVEYSFREYQMWIAEVCAGFGGRIHSVAGDGAVVAFADAAAAMGASRRIQTDVIRFNARTNRLPKPFRLRLGLHAGRVAGDLNDVQFTEVIDIAAHVEDIAPVGGIAATIAVVSQLGEDGFLPLSRDVDGQGVYIALVPTEG